MHGHLRIIVSKRAGARAFRSESRQHPRPLLALLGPLTILALQAVIVGRKSLSSALLSLELPADAAV